MDLALYAAIVGTVGTLTGVASLLWQMMSERHKKQTRLEVKVVNLLPVPSGEWCVGVEAINHSTYPIRITSVWLDAQDNSGRTAPFIHQPLGSTLPGEIGPNDSGSTWMPRGALEEIGFDFKKPVTAGVAASNGRRFTSRPSTLRAD